MRKTSNPREEVAEVRRRLKAAGDPRAASLAKSALRSPLSFHGAVPPRVRSLAREMARRHRGDRSLEPLLAVARLLWRSRWHEERSTALHLLAAFVRRLDHGHWKELKSWLKGVRSADHCDGIAVELLGSLVKRDRSWCRVLKHWTLSESVWERRASALGVLLRTRQMGDVEAAFDVCETLMRERAPAVREGVVELLWEARRSDPAATQAFLDRWKGKGDSRILEALSF